jgi:hypothetical protein
MAKRMVLLLLVIPSVGLGGCDWHDSGREEYRPGDYSQGDNGSGYHRQAVNTPG